MISVEYKIKQVLGNVSMRFERLFGQDVAIYEMSHKKALRKLLQVIDINEITEHAMFVVPGRFIWRRA